MLILAYYSIIITVVLDQGKSFSIPENWSFCGSQYVEPKSAYGVLQTDRIFIRNSIFGFYEP